MIQHKNVNDLSEKEINFIKNSLTQSKQVTSVAYVKLRIIDFYFIKKENSIIAFSCNKTSLIKNFDIEVGYSWVNPKYRGNIYGIKLFNFQLKNIRNNKIKAYSINQINNNVMVKYCEKNNFKVFHSTDKLQWRYIK